MPVTETAIHETIHTFPCSVSQMEKREAVQKMLIEMAEEKAGRPRDGWVFFNPIKWGLVAHG